MHAGTAITVVIHSKLYQEMPDSQHPAQHPDNALSRKLLADPSVYTYMRGSQNYGHLFEAIVFWDLDWGFSV